MKLSIANTTISQDKQGRYSLADLHQASGGLGKHRPTYWLKNKNTQETIALLKAELEDGIPSSKTQSDDGIPSSPVASFRSGKYDERGTFVVWELVYDYAMWVSPAFKLIVIRAFHVLQARPQLQHEKALAQKYEFYPPLRALALQGKKDSEIAPVLGRSPGSVGYHRNKQFNEGYTDPLEYAHKRYTPNTAAKVIAKRGWDAWGSDYVPPQFELSFS